VIWRQFGHVKVRYCGLAKRTVHLETSFALSNVMARFGIAAFGMSLVCSVCSRTIPNTVSAVRQEGALDVQTIDGFRSRPAHSAESVHESTLCQVVND
jgi:hypothetical protein